MNSTNEKIEIREVKQFGQRIYTSVLSLLKQLSPDAILPDEAHLNEIIESENSYLFVAELNEQIVGMLTVVTYNIPSGMKTWIEDVVVDAELRGKGIGKLLTMHAIEFAKSTGAASIELTSRPSRVSANKLYQEIGFQQRETNCYKLLIK